MKTILCIGLLVLGVLVSMAADSPDVRSIEGNWTPDKAELAGQPMPEAVLKTISLKLRDGSYEVSVAGHPDKGTYRLDSHAKPKSITITGTEGPNKGKTFPSIYKLQDDTLLICYDLSGKQRPTEFKTLPRTKLYLVTYKRSK
jgi:uncharacterized protein (TIGR03067 family)